MFRITEDPSSGNLVQYLAKITRMVLSCPVTWTWSVLWQHILHLQYADTTPTTFMSPNTIEPFL